MLINGLYDAPNQLYTDEIARHPRNQFYHIRLIHEHTLCVLRCKYIVIIRNSVLSKPIIWFLLSFAHIQWIITISNRHQRYRTTLYCTSIKSRWIVREVALTTSIYLFIHLFHILRLCSCHLPLHQQQYYNCRRSTKICCIVFWLIWSEVDSNIGIQLANALRTSGKWSINIYS